ncbi:uncharacterized protein Z519_06988 [Cladophialophora bantiana CBS 173.52]|uniref:DUF202 domain-containing protein n=1 Tax=Cladophialophora bantiana (strain ATCC 10958 / CBS 173.52 / CDC B-1940 / NIH 8579) TaxID=1442370 RepID=A0A0D2EQ10_CLAB1|nr:uncharacterized protein Z519_06988 [Cladophialophora bantiana CBS 173.52]KIW92006.1 hypothetical protein Z519_06988 [Cladophialophora bantiana CBS 173.52]
MAVRRRFRSSSAVHEIHIKGCTTSIYQSCPVSSELSSCPTVDATSDDVEIARQFWDGIEQTGITVMKASHPEESWSLRKFWDEYVAVEMEFGYNAREHITNEETFISWFEFAFGMAGFGLVVLQFGILHGRFIESKVAAQLGKAVACASFVISILSVVVGAYRFFRQQNALLRGQVCLGGLSMFSAIFLFSLVLVGSTVITWIGLF